MSGETPYRSNVDIDHYARPGSELLKQDLDHLVMQAMRNGVTPEMIANALRAKAQEVNTNLGDDLPPTN